MNYDEEENTLKQLFEQLKQADSAHTPPFAKAWEVARSRMGKSRTTLPIGRIALATVPVILLVGAFLSFFKQPPNVTGESEISKSVSQLYEWRSPTEFLLKAPGEQLLNSVPTLGKPLFEIPQTTNLHASQKEKL